VLRPRLARSRSLRRRHLRTARTRLQRMEARFVSALENDGSQLRAELEQTRALARKAGALAAPAVQGLSESDVTNRQ
jgi:hypothetical protein